MTISASNLYFYADAPKDLTAAFWASLQLGVNAANVTSEYSVAANWVATSNNTRIVIAVGGPAVNRLYCGTPYLYEYGPLSVGLPNNYFMNGNGYTAYDSIGLAYVLGFYALYEIRPVPLPEQFPPTC